MKNIYSDSEMGISDEQCYIKISEEPSRNIDSLPVPADNSITIRCGPEGNEVSVHSNELSFNALMDRVYELIKLLPSSTQDDPELYHG